MDRVNGIKSPESECYDVSIVVPLNNEELNLRPLLDKINSALSMSGKTFEVIFVNDGSTDDSEQILKQIYSQTKNVTVINLFRKKGKASALEAGMGYTRGRYIVTLDADLQYDPDDIPMMINELEKGSDAVSGNRLARGDKRSVIITSLFFNYIIRKLTGLNFKDFFSGLKCFKREVIDFLSLYGDLYRFAVIFACKQNFIVKEVPIRHYPRSKGNSKYTGFKRSGLAVLDIIAVLLTVTFNENVAYYAGLIGAFLIAWGTFFLSFSLFNHFLSLTGLSFRLGIIFAFFGIQLLLLKKISNDFFYRHQREQLKRKNNIKEILIRK